MLHHIKTRPRHETLQGEIFCQGFDSQGMKWKRILCTDVNVSRSHEVNPVIYGEVMGFKMYSTNVKHVVTQHVICGVCTFIWMQYRHPHSMG